MEKEMENKNNLSLENWLWEAACSIRGEIDAPKYKDFILPLIFLKRLSDVFEDELNNLDKDKKTAKKLVGSDHSLVRFFVPEKSLWENLVKQTTSLGEYITDAMRSLARENPKLEGVIDAIDFNHSDSGQRTISDASLRKLIEILNRKRLGLKDVDTDLLGRAYEYLLRKFVEGSGQSAGEFYTPPTVAKLMSYLLDPEPGDEIYDPTCGTAGLLIKCNDRFIEKYDNKPKIKQPHYYGQEINQPTYAMAKINAFIHDMPTEIAIGDTMNRPAFKESNGGLKRFDKVLANPMWNQKFDQTVYEGDSYNRFTFGYPPYSHADWGWIQHMFSSIKENGKLSVIIDTGALSRGSGDDEANKEKVIRKAFIEKDLIEAVILLPDNLFYSTSSAGTIIIINKNKKHKNEVLLINSSKLCEKGRPKNFLRDEDITFLTQIYTNWKEEKNISKVLKLNDLQNADYSLSPSRFVIQDAAENLPPIEELIIELKKLETERFQIDKELNGILKELGFQK
jgi:type I restriction enzyme M protein